jgi:hypothetical protein
MGMGKALKIFEEMGFEADTLAALNFADPVQKIAIMADELAKMQEPSDRLAAVIKLFGTGGDKMAAFFGRGSSAIADMATKAERMGMVVNEMDAQGIADVVQKTEELADAWAGFGTVLARDVYPILTESIKMLTQAIRAASFTFTNPEMKGEKPLTLGQQAAMRLNWHRGGIEILGYDILFGEKVTDAQKAAYSEGQARRGMDALRNEVGGAPVIGKYLERLVDIGERQLEQKENRNAVD